MIGTGVRRDDWDRHWTDFEDSSAQNPAQAMRRRMIDELLQGTGPGSRILDLGCGKGDLLGELAWLHPGAELHGVDASRHAVELAARSVPAGSFAARDLLAPGGPPPDRAGWATHAVCSEVLEHVDEPTTLLANAKAYLAPGCRLIVTVPGGPMSAFDRHIGHRRHFTTERLRALLTEAGFTVETVTGAGFPLFDLYRLAVIVRGERLVRDAARSRSAPPSVAARVATGLFGLLLAAPQPRNRLGWQLLAVARLPEGGEKPEALPC